MRIYAAPMQSITTDVYRRLHAEIFGGVDRYYTPFYSPTQEHRLTARDLRELSPERNDLTAVVPQIMARRGAEFAWAAQALFDMGYGEVNLNLGCPSGTVTAKGKGAGLLARPEELAALLEEGFAALPGRRVSIKTRLGFRDEGEFDGLLALYHRFPVAELIIHARVREDFYKVPVRRAAFAAALPKCRLPVCYNGDLLTAGDCRDFWAAFPAVESVMLGRGLIADPALARKLRGGPPASREEVRAFCRRMYQEYRAEFGSDAPASQRMKEQWAFLIRLFRDEGGRYDKQMRRLRRTAEYETTEAAILKTLPLREEADWTKP